jgi:hypothetical protein
MLFADGSLFRAQPFYLLMCLRYLKRLRWKMRQGGSCLIFMRFWASWGGVNIALRLGGVVP